MRGGSIGVAIAAVVAALPNPARAVVGFDIDSNGDIDNAIVLNDVVSASTLYSSTTYTPTIFGGAFSISFNGDFGQGSTVAVIDLGLVDNTNPALTNVSTYSNINLPATPPGNLVGDHATAVAQFAAGLNSSTSDNLIYLTDIGIAPLATLWSGSIIDSGDPNGVNQQTTDSVAYPFVQFMQTGVNGTTADVVNVSLGAQNVPASSDFFSNLIDGLAAQNPHTTVAIAAGNDGAPAAGAVTGTVNSPGTAFNGITVGALASDPTLAYQGISDYSSRGNADFFNPVTGQTLYGMRPAVDLVAPGDYFITSATPIADEPGYYSIDYGAGTSFATPLVSGAVAQLDAYAHTIQQLVGQPGLDATDSRVIKAVLLNSADKLPGWNNGQSMINGVLTTSQGLDSTLGAGALNVSRAADNYLNGAFDPQVVGSAFVGPKGWDLSTVTAGSPNIYDLGQLTAGQTLTATLDWFADDTYDSTSNTPSINRFANLDLEVLENLGPNDTQEIALSDALYNNVQQLSFTLNDTADYELEVVYAGVQFDSTIYPVDALNPGDSEEYGLAWSNVLVPEPVELALIAPLFLLFRRRRNARP